jgi:hypothetical protein
MTRLVGVDLTNDRVRWNELAADLTRSQSIGKAKSEFLAVMVWRCPCCLRVQ